MQFRKCAASAAGISFFVAATLSTLVLPRTAMAIPAPAAFTITIAPDGAGNITASGSGDVNFSGAQSMGNTTDTGSMAPSNPFIFNGPASNTSLTTYDFTSSLTGPANFGIIGDTFAGTGSGSMFGFAYPTPGSSLELFVPSGYANDTPFTDTATYFGATLSSLGLTPNTYTWSTGSSNTDNTITIIVTSTPTPEPATLSLLGLGSLALLRRRRAL